MTASLLAAVISLSTFLGMLGAPSIPNAESYTVAFGTDGPEGIRGVACHSDFRRVDGHAQALCGDLPDNTIVLYPEFIDGLGMLLDTVAHESCHLALGVVPGRSAWERFQEATCYAVGRAYALRAMGEIR